MCRRPSASDVLRAPAELALRARGVEDASARVARTRLAMDRLAVDAGDLGTEPMELVHRRLERGPDVVDAAAPGRREGGLDDVADVDVVARLLAVAEDERLLAAPEPFHEDRDDPALERGRLARPVDVGEAQDGVARAVDAVPAGEVLLRAELGDSVRGHRPPRRLLGRRCVDVAVDRAAGGREDDLGAAGARRLERVDGADDVHLGVEARLLHRGADVRLRRQVEDRVGLDLVGPADVVDDELRRLRDPLAPPGGEDRRRRRPRHRARAARRRRASR